MEKLEKFLELGGVKKDIILLVISGLALLLSIFDAIPLPFDIAWIAILLCGIPIILEAVIGLVTAFDIKADVLVSMALIASVMIGEDFAAGEVASVSYTHLDVYKRQRYFFPSICDILDTSGMEADASR